MRDLSFEGLGGAEFGFQAEAGQTKGPLKGGELPATYNTQRGVTQHWVEPAACTSRDWAYELCHPPGPRSPESLHSSG